MGQQREPLKKPGFRDKIDAEIIHPRQGRLHFHRPTTVALVVLASALACLGQQGGDPEAELQRTRERILPDLARLPHYTCIQSITRKYFRAPASAQRQECSALIAAHDSRKHELAMESWDRLRLEVAIINNGDIFSWVGAPRFDEGAFEQFAGHGPLGSGDFGTFLSEILSRATVKFEREVVVDGRRLLEFSYDMPLEVSAYRVNTVTGWAPTAYSGTFRVDADARDIASLTVRSAELPPSSFGCQVASEVEYGRTPIHDSMILIPRETRFSAIYLNGAETLSQTNYASCREYASRSRILFKAPKNGGGGSAAVGQSPVTTLPAGLHFNARIVTSIDSDTAWAGDPLEAILSSPIRDKKHKVLAPAGTPVHGRLVRMEHQSEPFAMFRLGVQLESIEIDGQTVRLEARPSLSQNQEPEIYRGWMQQRVDRPAIGVFNFQVKHLQLKHLDSQWITSAPSTEGNQGATDNR